MAIDVWSMHNNLSIHVLCDNIYFYIVGTTIFVIALSSYVDSCRVFWGGGNATFLAKTAPKYPEITPKRLIAPHP